MRVLTVIALVLLVVAMYQFLDVLSRPDPCPCPMAKNHECIPDGGR